MLNYSCLYTQWIMLFASCWSTIGVCDPMVGSTKPTMGVCDPMVGLTASTRPIMGQQHAGNGGNGWHMPFKASQSSNACNCWHWITSLVLVHHGRLWPHGWANCLIIAKGWSTIGVCDSMVGSTKPTMGVYGPMVGLTALTIPTMGVCDPMVGSHPHASNMQATEATAGTCLLKPANPPTPAVAGT